MSIAPVRTRESEALARFLEAAEALGLTREEQARLLGLALSTYRRRVRSGRLEPAEVAAAQFLPDLLHRAEAAFGDPERARRWLITRQRILGARPVELLGDLKGYHQVEAALGGAVYGHY